MCVQPDSVVCFFLMIRRPPRSTLDRSSAASDVYKRQVELAEAFSWRSLVPSRNPWGSEFAENIHSCAYAVLSLIHISEPTRPY